MPWCARALVFEEVLMSANAPFVDSLEVPALTKAHLVGLLAEQLGLNGREATDMMEFLSWFRPVSPGGRM